MVRQQPLRSVPTDEDDDTFDKYNPSNHESSRATETARTNVEWSITLDREGEKTGSSEEPTAPGPGEDSRKVSARRTKAVSGGKPKRYAKLDEGEDQSTSERRVGVVAALSAAIKSRLGRRSSGEDVECASPKLEITRGVPQWEDDTPVRLDVDEKEEREPQSRMAVASESE